MVQFTMHLALVSVLVLIATATQAQRSEERIENDDARPKWEFGLGAGGGVTPHYPASDQTSFKALVVPTFRYRGKFLRADDEGARARMINGEDFELDLSGAASFPVSSGDNHARNGMSQLDWIGEIGPRANWKIKFEGGRTIVRMYFPLRAVFSSDTRSIAHRGWSLQPGVSVSRRIGNSSPPPGRAKLRLFLDSSVVAIDQSLAAYFYGVSTDDATPVRKAYNARSGLLAVNTSIALMATQEIATYFIGFQHSLTAVSSNRESSLHKSDSQIAFVVGLNVMFWGSRDNDPAPM